MLELNHETFAHLHSHGYFIYAMKIDICSILVTLIVSSFHTLKVHMVYNNALLCLEIFLMKLQKITFT